MKLGDTDYKIKVGLGTSVTKPEYMLVKEAPNAFMSMTPLELADHIMQDEYEGRKQEIAVNVQRILSARRLGGITRNYVMEINGTTVNPNKPIAQYANLLVDDASAKDEADPRPAKVFYIKVAKRDGGGLDSKI